MGERRSGGEEGEKERRERGGGGREGEREGEREREAWGMMLFKSI